MLHTTLFSFVQEVSLFKIIYFYHEFDDLSFFRVLSYCSTLLQLSLFLYFATKISFKYNNDLKLGQLIIHIL